MSLSGMLGVLEFRSRGFELCLPPTPTRQNLLASLHTYAGRLESGILRCYYQTPLLGNTTPWSTLALHTVHDPAIVFPPEQCDMLQIMDFATGFLVSIESRDQRVFVARKVGRVNVKPLEQGLMNWAALRSLKGDELPAEMRAGLLKRVWNRRPNATTQAIPYVTSKHILDSLPRPWHRDGAALNYELDQRFAGGVPLWTEQHWRLCGVEFSQIEKSKERAGGRVLS